MTISQLCTFLGWCTISNIIVRTLAWLLLTFFNRPIKRIHKQFFALNDKQLNAPFFLVIVN
ncbi:DUF6868 family protein [Thalassotalea ponticola]|uniref:DUF6868 family protein n=1 Tax=Thalassotalea ponticola TaxID=1523392 RepID=UPI00338F5963